jgi:hypothetical protein
LKDWRRLVHDPMDRALLAYSEKLTFESHRLTGGDLHALRSAGYTERQVLDCILVASYRHYIVRVADATGIEVEEGRVEKTILDQFTYSRDGDARSSAQQQAGDSGESEALPGAVLSGPWIRAVPRTAWTVPRKCGVGTVHGIDSRLAGGVLVASIVRGRCRRVYPVLPVWIPNARATQKPYRFTGHRSGPLSVS